MAAPTIEQMMLGIEARLATISGLETSPTDREQINPPQAIVGVPTIPSYHATMTSGRFQLVGTITVLVSKILDREGQLALAAYANPTGSSSVKAAVEGDKTLGGVVDDCVIVAFRPLGAEEVGALGYYGGEFAYQAIAVGF